MEYVLTTLSHTEINRLTRDQESKYVLTNIH